MIGGLKMDKSGFSFNHEPQQVLEEKLKGDFMKETTKDILKQISLLESEGKFDEAKKLRSKLTKING